MATISNPILTDGVTAVEMPHPSNWSIDYVAQRSVQTSLAGRDMTDVLSYKHRYILFYEAITVEDFNAIYTLLKEHYKNGTELYFSYDKFPQTYDIQVVAKIGSRGFTAGSGIGYISTFELELLEVKPR